MIAENLAHDVTACVQHPPDEQGWPVISCIPGAAGFPLLRHVPPLPDNLHKSMQERSAEYGESFSVAAMFLSALNVHVREKLSAYPIANLCRAVSKFLNGRSIPSETPDNHLSIETGIATPRCPALLLHLAKRYCVLKHPGTACNDNKVPLTFHRDGLPRASHIR